MGKPDPCRSTTLGHVARHLVLDRRVAAPSGRRPASPKRTLPRVTARRDVSEKISMLSAMSPMRARRTGSLAQAGNLVPYAHRQAVRTCS